MNMNLATALNTSLRDALANDESALILGEDVAKLGGVFRVTDGLLDTFGPRRVVDTPLGEAGIVGTAIGLAMAGYRPVCEIQFDGFVFTAMNQITTQLARIYHRSRGYVSLPVTIRIPVAGGIGAIEHHSESPEAYFTHTPGLRVVTCSSPQDGYSLLRSAISCEDPVIFLEPKSRYWDKAEVDVHVETDLESSVLLRDGSDVLLVAYGATVRSAMEAAEELATRGIRCAVVDLRVLSPLDTDFLMPLVRRIGRVVVVHEASLTGGIGGEIAARITESEFYSLEAPVLRVTGFDTPYPVSHLENSWLPNTRRISEAVLASMDF